MKADEGRIVEPWVLLASVVLCCLGDCLPPCGKEGVGSKRCLSPPGPEMYKKKGEALVLVANITSSHHQVAHLSYQPLPHFTFSFSYFQGVPRTYSSLFTH